MPLLSLVVTSTASSVAAPARGPREAPRDAGSADDAGAAADAGAADSGGADAEAPPESPPPQPEPPAAAAAGIGPLTGRAFAYVRGPVHEPIDTPLQQASASVWVEAKPRFNDTTSAAVSVSLDAMHSSIDTTKLRAHVREAYVEAMGSGLQLRIGQQIIPWGNADIVNPTDFLGARDYAFFAVDPEVRRLGNAHLLASWTPDSGNSPFQFTLVWTPVLQGSRQLVPPTLLPGGITIAPTIDPSMSLENSEAAARITYHGESWDAALVGFRGYNHNPEFVLVSAAPTGIVVAQTYREIRALGAEASLSAGAWVFRFEGAYVWTENKTGGRPWIQPSHFDAVVGVERPVLERLRIQAQGLVRYSPFFRSVRGAPSADPGAAAILEQVAQTNSVLLAYQNRVMPGGTLRVAYTSENERFEAEAVGVMYVDTRGANRLSYFLRPLLTYRLSDALKASLGMEFFGGRRDTTLGVLNYFSGVFVGADYRF